MLKYFLLAYISVLSIADLILMHYDKRCAQKHKRRIPERTLLGLAILGGGIGLLFGMCIFHHKTLHFRFKITAPLTAVFWALLTLWAFFPRCFLT